MTFGVRLVALKGLKPSDRKARKSMSRVLLSPLAFASFVENGIFRCIELAALYLLAVNSCLVYERWVRSHEYLTQYQSAAAFTSSVNASISAISKSKNDTLPKNPMCRLLASVNNPVPKLANICS
eukprot:scaffold45133_cov212-Skeletonema_marinoi.AAC.1